MLLDLLLPNFYEFITKNLHINKDSRFLKMLIFKIVLFVSFFFTSQGYAAQFKENFVPYFASIKSSEVNVRKGPNTRYPIEWVYTKKGEPVEVIAQFEHWYRIKDFNGDEGWVKSIMVTNRKRTGIVIPKQDKKSAEKYVKVLNTPDHSSKIIANIELSKRVDLIKCNKNWCQIKVASIMGWIEKTNLWGVYSQEEFK